MPQNSPSLDNFVQVSNSRSADGESLVPSILPAAGSGNFKIARGQKTTVSAVDTVVTGLATVVSVVAVLEADITLDPMWVTAQVGDQAGAPAAGSIIIKTWKPTSNADSTPLAATTFSKKVNWVAIGT